MASIVEQTPFNEYTGNGVTTAFGFEFQLLNNGDFVASIDGVEIPSSDYTLSSLTQAGGTCTFDTAPANGAAVLLQRVIALARDTDYQYNGDLREETLDRDFNRMWQALQGQAAGLGGALRLPYPEQAAELPAIADRADKILSFDSNGDPVATAPVAGTATALAVALASTASASGGAGLSGINQTLNYVAGTIGYLLNDVCHDARSFPWLAKFDGTTDDTAAIAACIAATANGTVLLPANAAKVAATIPVGVTCRIRGVSSNSVISTSHATNDVFQVSAAGVVFEGFQITASVARSGGYFINFNGSANANNYSRVSGMTLTQWFNGIGITGGGSTAYHLYDLIMSTSIVAGIGIVQSTTANAVDVIARDVLIIGPTSGSQLTAGIQIHNSGDTTLCRVSTVKCGIGLSLVPQNGQRIQALIISDSYFDSGDGAGVQANPAAGATIDLLKMSNTWVCTNVNGVSLGPSGTGLIQCVELFNCTMSNHAAGTGLTSTSVVTNLRVVGGSASANVNGVSIGANQNEFSIIGLRAGPCGEFAGNSGTGIAIAAGTSNNYSIIGCDLRGNTGAALTDSGTGTTKYVYANIGVNPGATGTVAVGASPFTYTAGGSPATAYVAGGTVSNITISGQSTGLAAGTFRLGPRQPLVITYTVAPTLVVTTE